MKPWLPCSPPRSPALATRMVCSQAECSTAVRLCALEYAHGIVAAIVTARRQLHCAYCPTTRAACVSRLEHVNTDTTRDGSRAEHCVRVSLTGGRRPTAVPRENETSEESLQLLSPASCDVGCCSLPSDVDDCLLTAARRHNGAKVAMIDQIVDDAHQANGARRPRAGSVRCPAQRSVALYRISCSGSTAGCQVMALMGAWPTGCHASIAWEAFTAPSANRRACPITTKKKKIDRRAPLVPTGSCHHNTPFTMREDSVVDRIK